MAAIAATNVTHTAALTWPAIPGVASDPALGDTVPNGGRTILVMNNTAASPGTVTIESSATVDELAVADRVFTVPANTVQIVKLGPVNTYGTSTKVTTSANTIRLAAYTVA